MIVHTIPGTVPGTRALPTECRYGLGPRILKVLAGRTSYLAVTGIPGRILVPVLEVPVQVPVGPSRALL